MTENTLIAIDSLVANEFAVELDGQPLTGIFRVAGLTTFRLESNGNVAHDPFQVVKMVQRDANNPFNAWLRQTLAAKNTGNYPTRTLDVVAIDDGVETRRWSVKGARIIRVAYSSFDTASSEMVEEIVTIDYDGIEETWGASG